MNAPMKSASGDWLRIAEALQPETVKLRRAIHREPEIGLHNPATAAKVKAALAGLPLELREGPATTGLVAILRGARPRRTVLLRGDTDALGMPETIESPFKSQREGLMHACGHDSHTAMLASAAKALAHRREALAGTVVFMFQPGEEGHHGARFMIEDGLLDDPAPDAAFALHIMPNAPAGVFASRPGTLLASSDTVRINIVGRGGHASMPHDAVDPVPVACEIVLALQSFLTRRINAHDPAVLTFGRIEAGSASNVIPEIAHLLGTVRAVSERTRSDMHAGIQRVAAHIALAHGAHAEIEIEKGFPVTVCNAEAVRHAHLTLQDAFGLDAWRTMPTPVMGAEDFSYVLQKIKGAMIFMGVCPDGQDWRTACPCHSNRMELNEDAMARGVAAHCILAERFLAEGFAS
jgi:hippurate hydrolase